MFEETCDDGQVSKGTGPEDPAPYDKDDGAEGWKWRGVLYTTGNIEDIFRCISVICTRNTASTPLKSNPCYVRTPHPYALQARPPAGIR